MTTTKNNDDFEFDEEKDVIPSNWIKFEKVGDRFAGTLISVRTAKNSLNGEDQQVYELLKKDGSIWNLGGKPGIDAQMRNIKIGQIIGFYFAEERKPSKPGYNPTKIIKVLTKGEMNEEWLAENTGGSSKELEEVFD